MWVFLIYWGSKIFLMLNLKLALECVSQNVLMPFSGSLVFITSISIKWRCGFKPKAMQGLLLTFAIDKN